MKCDRCGRFDDAISYDVEHNVCICSMCRSKINAQIKPRRCPFCNGHDLSLLHDTGGDYDFIFCNCCKACGPAAVTQLDAITDWNAATRARV